MGELDDGRGLCASRRCAIAFEEPAWLVHVDTLVAAEVLVASASGLRVTAGDRRHRQAPVRLGFASKALAK